jgi:hypothetical protein
MDLRAIESGLRKLVESQLLRPFHLNRPEDRVLQGMVEAMKAGAKTDSTGHAVAPNAFAVLVAPGTLANWKAQLSDTALLDALREVAGQTGLRFAVPPSVSLREDPIPSGRAAFHIMASFEAPLGTETQDVWARTPSVLPPAQQTTVPEHCFLIVEGARQFELSEPVVNVGRRLDNHLVIEDQRVSRQHAQLRAIGGHFVLFDLNSSGGSFVNGRRTSQCILQAGDVISLAGVTLIYAEDSSVAIEQTSKTPAYHAGGDRPTMAAHRPDPSGKATE